MIRDILHLTLKKRRIFQWKIRENEWPRSGWWKERQDSHAIFLVIIYNSEKVPLSTSVHRIMYFGELNTWGYLKNCVLVCLDRHRQTNKQTKSGARFKKNVSSGLWKFEFTQNFLKINVRIREKSIALAIFFAFLVILNWKKKIVREPKTRTQSCRHFYYTLVEKYALNLINSSLYLSLILHNVPSYGTGGRAQIRAVWRNMWMKWHQYDLKSNKIRPPKRIFL